MSMPVGGMGPLPPQQQSMMSPHQQQMVAQQQHQQAAAAAAQAAAAAAAQQAQQQGHPIMQSGVGGPPGGSVPPGGMPGQPHPSSQGPPGGPGSNQPSQNQPGQPPQGPQQGGPSSQQEQARVDNISKAKALIPNLRESMLNVMRNASLAISANNMIDSGTKQVDYDVSRFDKSFEEFFSLVDQLEVHLRTSVECLNQSGQSSKYLPVPVMPNKSETSMTYPQYLDLVKGQIAYAKEIHGALTEASQRLTE